MQKKAQITVFIIIVLVILMMFGVVYYILGATVTRETEEQVLRQQISAEKIDPLRKYITSCLSLSSSEGLELLGKQGGYIYKSQGGFIPDPVLSDIGKEYIDYEQTKVHYGIYAPIANVGTIFFSKTPDYPWPTFPEVYHPLTGELGNPEYLEGYYGRNKIPPLEKPKKDSIHEQLENFTLNGVISCADWTAFRQQGLNITTEEANVTVLLAERDVTFTLNWPVKIEDLGTGAITDMDRFMVIYPVRLEKIHKFASIVMDNDAGNISFDIRASDGVISSNVIEGVFGRDDLIVIRDTESRIIDKEYEFRFVRKNRAPALYYIHEITRPICNGSLIQAVSENLLNVVDSCKDNSFEINITALDPDEDNVEITFGKRLPYEIEPFDVIERKFTLKINAGDGEYTDWQEISIPTKTG